MAIQRENVENESGAGTIEVIKESPEKKKNKDVTLCGKPIEP